MRANAHRPESGLHVGHHLSLDQHDVSRNERENRHNHQGIDERQNMRPEEFNEPVHQRSTSPNTISRVPIIATTSATMWPRTILSKACKLTNDGGRILTRYGCTVPSLTR